MKRPNSIFLAFLVLLLCGGTASAQNKGPDGDPFRGRLFPPDLILKHREDLGLSDDQLAAIRAAVIEVQSTMPEYQWDLRESYQQVLQALDANPIDEAVVLDRIELAMRAENDIKKLQVAMLIKIRNLLDDRQIDYLKSVKDRKGLPRS